jgi:hypothetical protein
VIVGPVKEIFPFVIDSYPITPPAYILLVHRKFIH